MPTSDPQLATTEDLLKREQRSLFGKYRAMVTANEDPDRLGRIKALVPSIFGDKTETDWMPGAFAFGGNDAEGLIFVPAVGSQVLVEFIEGDKSSPIWTAAYYPSADKRPASFDRPQGTLQLLRTRGGMELRLEDDGGDDQRVRLAHPKGARIEIDPDGAIHALDEKGAGMILDPVNDSVTIKGQGQGEITMDSSGIRLQHGGTRLEITAAGVTATGASVALDGDNVTLGKGATAPLLNARLFLMMFGQHLHPHPAAPTGPPPPIPEASVSLIKVKGA
jgi:uncharacterized protein involved in type VI secretion and phage assembly